jgi:hypothetical protein
MCAVSFAAIFLIHSMEQVSHRRQGIQHRIGLSNEVRDNFHAAQCAVLQFRMSNDPELIKIVVEALDRASLCLERIHQSTTIQENKDLTLKQIELCQEFRACFHFEAVIGEEPPNVQQEQKQQQARQRTDENAEKAIAICYAMMHNQADVLGGKEEEITALVRMSMQILFIITAVALFFGGIICSVVVRLVNREPTSLYTEAETSNFSGPAPVPTSDMRIVADRLQEVVNLLRK